MSILTDQNISESWDSDTVLGVFSHAGAVTPFFPVEKWMIPWEWTLMTSLMFSKVTVYLKAYIHISTLFVNKTNVSRHSSSPKVEYLPSQTELHKQNNLKNKFKISCLSVEFADSLLSQFITHKQLGQLYLLSKIAQHRQSWFSFSSRFVESIAWDGDAHQAMLPFTYL